MQGFLNKFNEQYMGKQYIEIEFCNENPLSKRFERNNQGGKVCYCMEGTTTGKQKTKDGWKPIECNEQCQYRQKDKKGKSACNRIGWLKFFIPSICQNRIWLMRITGQESINRLDAFNKALFPNFSFIVSMHFKILFVSSFSTTFSNKFN